MTCDSYELLIEEMLSKSVLGCFIEFSRNSLLGCRKCGANLIHVSGGPGKDTNQVRVQEDKGYTALCCDKNVQ